MENAGPNDGGFLKAQGKTLVDARGRAVLLRGVGLGNWTLPEGYMWKFGPQGDRPRRIEKVVEKALGGKAEALAFWKAFRDRFITEADIRRIAELGFNSVRPALKSRDFVTEEARPRFLEEGFTRLDQLVAWCRKHNLYCLIDLHGAPGGQTGKNIDDSPRDHPELFKLRSNQDLTVELWKRIATRYRDDPVVGGYDLLNEPLPDEFGAYKRQLEPFYRRLTREIRAIDPAHTIILEGANWANDWSVFGQPFDSNLLYQFHKYWNDPDTGSIRGYLDFQDRWKVPVWVGEYGEPKVGIHWILAATQLFEDVGFSWSYWTWKRLDAEAPVQSVNLPKGWEKIQALSNGQAGPSPAEGRAILGEFLDNVLLEKCRENTPVVQALFRRVPNRIEAEDFGHLGEGKSYHVGNNGRRAARYRKGEPVAIEDLDGPPGHNVGWIEGGEWLEFAVDLPSSPSHTLRARIAAEGGGGVFHVEAGGRDLSGPVRTGGTGGWQKWAVVEKAGLALKAGPQALRLAADTGGFNLDWIELAPAAGPAARIEAESYTRYKDKDAVNQGGALKHDGVDVQAIEGSTGMGVALEKGEWLRYEVNSPVAQRLRLRLRAGSAAGAEIKVLLGGKTAAAFKVRGGFEEKEGGAVAVAAGRGYLTLMAASGSAKIDWVELVP